MVDNHNSTLSAIECAFCDEKCQASKFVPTLPSKQDFELIELNIGSIRTNLDKLATLDEIYRLQENVNSYETYAQNNGTYDLYKFKIDQCKKSIAQLINATNDVDVTVVRFTDFLKYPAGYGNT